MTCKDCLHYEMCIDTCADENWNDEAPKEIKEMFSPKGCEHFKNNADFVEVVHCAKCKNWVKTGYDTLLEVDFGFCYNTDFPFVCESRPIINGSSFCSYGEKK